MFASGNYAWMGNGGVDKVAGMEILDAALCMAPRLASPRGSGQVLPAPEVGN